VQALKEAGFDGMGYEDAKEKYLGTARPDDNGYRRLGRELERMGLFCGSLGSQPVEEDEDE
jgi:hypothetical protein